MNFLTESISVENIAPKSFNYKEKMDVLGITELYGEIAFIGVNNNREFRIWAYKDCKKLDSPEKPVFDLLGQLSELKASIDNKPVKAAITQIEKYLRAEDANTENDNS